MVSKETDRTKLSAEKKNKEIVNIVKKERLLLNFTVIGKARCLEQAVDSANHS